MRVRKYAKRCVALRRWPSNHIYSIMAMAWDRYVARQEKLKARTKVNSYNCLSFDLVFLAVFCESFSRISLHNKRNLVLVFAD